MMLPPFNGGIFNLHNFYHKNRCNTIPLFLKVWPKRQKGENMHLRIDIRGENM